MKALPVLDGPYFFINAKEAAKGQMLAVQAMRRRIVDPVLALAGVKGSPHVFSDTFAINLIHAGVDIFTVSQLLGHLNVKITQQHYLNFIPGYVERMSEATRKLDFGMKVKSGLIHPRRRDCATGLPWAARTGIVESTAKENKPRRRPRHRVVRRERPKEPVTAYPSLSVRASPASLRGAA